MIFLKNKRQVSNMLHQYKKEIEVLNTVNRNLTDDYLKKLKEKNKEIDDLKLIVRNMEKIIEDKNKIIEGENEIVERDYTYLEPMITDPDIQILINEMSKEND